MKWLLKVLLIFLFFVDMQDSVEEVLVLLHKLLGELHPFIKKYIVPAAKKIGADLLEIAAPEIGEVVSGRKNFKTFARIVGTKAVRKELGGGKTKCSVEHKEPFLEKVVQKSAALAKTILTR